MGDRKVYPSVPCCHLWEKNYSLTLQGLWPPALSTFLPDVSLLLLNMDPIYKVHLPTPCL